MAAAGTGSPISFSFLPISGTTTCSSQTFRWSYSTTDLSSITFLSLSLSPSTPSSPSVEVETLVPSLRLDTGLNFWTWNPVDRPAGTYNLHAFISGNYYAMIPSDSFTIINGSDTSCLISPSPSPSSSSSTTTGIKSTSIPGLSSAVTSQSAISRGPLAGIILGSLLVLVIIFALIFLLYRRRFGDRKSSIWATTFYGSKGKGSWGSSSGSGSGGSGSRARGGGARGRGTRSYPSSSTRSTGEKKQHYGQGQWTELHSPTSPRTSHGQKPRERYQSTTSSTHSFGLHRSPTSATSTNTHDNERPSTSDSHFHPWDLPSTNGPPQSYSNPPYYHAGSPMTLQGPTSPTINCDIPHSPFSPFVPFPSESQSRSRPPSQGQGQSQGQPRTSFGSQFDDVDRLDGVEGGSGSGAKQPIIRSPSLRKPVPAYDGLGSSPPTSSSPSSYTYPPTPTSAYPISYTPSAYPPTTTTARGSVTHSVGHADDGVDVDGEGLKVVGEGGKEMHVLIPDPPSGNVTPVVSRRGSLRV